MPEMTLSLCSGSPCFSRFPHSSSLHLSRCYSPSTNTAMLSILLCSSSGSSHCPPAQRYLRDLAAPPPAVSRRSSFECRASLSESESSVAGKPSSSSSAVLSDEVVGEVSGVGDAEEALQIITEKALWEGRRGRRVGLLLNYGHGARARQCRVGSVRVLRQARNFRSRSR